MKIGTQNADGSMNWQYDDVTTGPIDLRKYSREEWIEKWTDNYLGRSDEAKELEPFVKQNYGGQSYLPWATMVRMLYRQDPNAELWVDEDEDGNTCRTHSYDIVTRSGNVETFAQAFIHQVVVHCRFMGVKHTEIYPVQGLRYDAPKVVDQNMVNKAIQRAKAKVIALATGLGYRLYETGDLQFEDEKDETPVAPKETKKEPRKKASEPPREAVTSKSDSGEKKAGGPREPEVYELATYVSSNMEALDGALLRINKAFVKKYNFSITADDTLDDLLEKFSVIPKPEDTLRALKKMAADTQKGDS